jgi:FkbM family methyltransferase
MALNFGRPAELYRYFPFGTATAFVISEATRALIDPSRRRSYAQAGEDILIENYFDPAQPGFYVDVGCNHPIVQSNTLGLYMFGWKGLVVDGNPEVIANFSRVRPRDNAICAVVSDTEHAVEFLIANDSHLSTVSKEFAEGPFGRKSGVKKRVEVNTVRLQTVLEEAKVPADFELLSIDAEGHDFEVLTSFDIQAFRPRVIIIEMLGFSPSKHKDNPICGYLERNQYELRHYTFMNGIFVRR